ncbi:MAG: alginate lyase family protein [Pseudomonadota bacterium]
MPAINNLSLVSPLPMPDLTPSLWCFCFLNSERTFDAVSMNWRPADQTRLWQYNLHYFDYLRAPELNAVEKQQLIEHWIANNPLNCAPGWEPFTTSLRIVNWIFFLLQNPAQVTDTISKSLYHQTLWLERHDERHILANHYFENLKALFFAGCFFPGNDGHRWRRRSCKEISEQLKEQQLAHGGHYERSPQYHCLMLENYLDIFNLASSGTDRDLVKLKEEFGAESRAALDWLRKIVMPDGNIPLFNDSAFGVAPSLETLESYAHQLGVVSFAPGGQQSGDSQLVALEESGLYGVRCRQDMLLMDCGAIGPDYQPGHTHCDMLSFELMFDGERIIVDTGVSGYEPGPEREHERSTAAHNTVQIDELEQSEIWGAFRVGRRARKLGARAERNADGAVIAGSFDGFFGDGVWHLPSFRHERQIHVALSEGCIRGLEVIDNLQPLFPLTRSRERTSIHTLQSRIHLHPNMSVVPIAARKNTETRADKYAKGDIAREAGSAFELYRAGDLIAELRVAFPVNTELEIGERDLQVAIEPSVYCPQFGMRLQNHCITLNLRSRLPATLSYVIERR